MKTMLRIAVIFLSLAMTSCSLGLRSQAGESPDEASSIVEAVPSPTGASSTAFNLVAYRNPTLGVQLNYPDGWSVDEIGLTGPNREVIFYPADPEPFVTYLSISLETRTLDQVTDLYTQSVPDAARHETEINGHRAIRYTYSLGRVEYFVSFEDRLLLIITDRPTDATIQMLLGSLEFLR